MKLQVFNQLNSQKPRKFGRIPLRTISVYGSNGSISFSALCVQDLSITEETSVLFAKDTESRKDWYLSVSPEHKDGIRVRTKKNGGRMKEVETLSVSCRVVVDNILSDHKANKNVTLLVSSNGKKIKGVTWYQIVARPLRVDGKSFNE